MPQCKPRTNSSSTGSFLVYISSNVYNTELVLHKEDAGKQELTLPGQVPRLASSITRLAETGLALQVAFRLHCRVDRLNSREFGLKPLPEINTEATSKSGASWCE